MPDIIIFILACFLVLTPLLVHEAAHACLLARYGVKIKEVWLGLGPMLFRYKGFRIGMLPIGAALVPEGGQFKALPPASKMWVALAGPAASFLYGAILWVVANHSPKAEELHLALLVPLAYVNFVLAAVNILPLPPLDGYRAYSAWREMKGRPFSELQEKIAVRAGNGVIFGVGFFVIAKYAGAH